MDAEEFRRWYSVHRAAFPSVDAWMTKFQREPGEDGISQREIFQQWFEVLRQESLQDALEATRSLNRGERELPKSFDDHARTVRRIAAEIRSARSKTAYQFPKQVDGEIAYKCRACWDTGISMVLSAKSMQKVEAGEVAENRQLTTLGTRCNCSAGDRISQEFLTYDPSKMCSSPAKPTLSDLPRYEAWLEANRQARQPSQYDLSY